MQLRLVYLGLLIYILVAGSVVETLVPEWAKQVVFGIGLVAGGVISRCLVKAEEDRDR